MMNRDLMLSAGAGVLSGVMAMSMLSGIPAGMLMTYFASLPLFFAGLGLGLGSMAVLAGSSIGTASLLSGSILAGGAFALLNVFPAMLALFLVLQRNPTTPSGWYPAGYALAWLAASSATIIAAAALYSAMAGGGLSVDVGRAVEGAIGRLSVNLPGDVVGGLTTFLAGWFPGLFGVSWVLMTVINGSIAQGVLSRGNKNQRPSPNFAVLVLPGWMPLLLVGAAVLALFGGGEIAYLGRNLVIALATPFFFVGLAFALVLLRRLRLPSYLLTAVIVIALIFAEFAAILAALGFVEQLTGLRQKLATPPVSREKE